MSVCSRKDFNDGKEPRTIKLPAMPLTITTQFSRPRFPMTGP
jgi:hypothetical protein